MGSLADKVIVITGATKGIGRSIAQAFFKEGAKLALCSLNPKEYENLDREFSATPDKIFYARCDVRNCDGVRSFVQQVQQKFGRIDILVNNAGIGIFNKIADFTVADWQKVWDTNLNGCFYFCREVIPVMKQNTTPPKGYIFNIGSLSHNSVVNENSVYSGSKSALKVLSDHLFNELRAEDLLVSYIAAGSVDTTLSRYPDLKGWKIKPGEIADIIVQMASLGYLNSHCCITYAEIKARTPILGECYKE